MTSNSHQDQSEYVQVEDNDIMQQPFSNCNFAELNECINPCGSKDVELAQIKAKLRTMQHQPKNTPCSDQLESFTEKTAHLQAELEQVQLALVTETLSHNLLQRKLDETHTAHQSAIDILQVRLEGQVERSDSFFDKFRFEEEAHLSLKQEHQILSEKYEESQQKLYNVGEEYNILLEKYEDKKQKLYNAEDELDALHSQSSQNYHVPTFQPQFHQNKMPRQNFQPRFQGNYNGNRRY